MYQITASVGAFCVVILLEITQKEVFPRSNDHWWRHAINQPRCICTRVGRSRIFLRNKIVPPTLESQTGQSSLNWQ